MGEKERKLEMDADMFAFLIKKIFEQKLKRSG